MNNYTLWCFGYRSAAWDQIPKGMRACCSPDGRENSINCPNCPVCVTYIPVYMTKPRSAKRTISDGQTTQRTPHSLNMCAILLINYRYAEKPLEVRGKVELHTSASLVLCIQTAFQPIDPEWGSSAHFSNAHSLAQEQGPSPPPPFTCRTGMFTRWVLPGAVCIRLYKATGEGLLDARKQVQWKPAIQEHERTFPSPCLRSHI